MLNRYLMKAVMYAFLSGATIGLIVITDEKFGKVFYILQCLILAALSASYVIRLHKKMAAVSVVGP